MANVTYRVVVPFKLNADGIIVAGEAKEAPNGEAARRHASSVTTAAGDVVAVALSQAGDPVTGDFSKV